MHACIALLIFLCPATSWSFNAADTLHVALRQLEVTASAENALPRLSATRAQFGTAQIIGGRRFLGEADVVNNIKSLAGIGTAGDYGAGLLVDGADASHTIMRMAGVPVFFPYRFGGVFSAFNTPHFASMTFSRGMHGASMPSRLGARLDAEPASGADHFGAVVNVGMMASSATFKVPVGKKFFVGASARVSYIDQVYGRFLHFTNSQLRCNFYDANLTAVYDIDGGDNIVDFNVFRSKDHIDHDDANYGLITNIDWTNNLASLRWRHNGAVAMSHRVYYTGFGSTLAAEMPQFAVSVPSAISAAAIAGDFRLDKYAPLSCGYELQRYSNTAQTVSLDGLGNSAKREQRRYHPFEGRLWADVSLFDTCRVSLRAGISASLYHNTDGYTAAAVDPRVTATLHTRRGDVALHIGRYSQYLSQLGFSQTGMASDFWIAARHGVPAQSAWSVEASYDVEWYRTTLSAAVYCRRVHNQSEYFGQVLDLISADYSVEKFIMTGTGYNTGINFAAQRAFGPVEASLTAAYGVARRRFDGYAGFLRGRTDAGLSLNANAAWHLGSHWLLGANFRFAQGRPYTPIKAMYMISGNIINDYGMPNSRRYPPYHSLDLSATWRAVTHSSIGDITHMLNFSIINAYGHRNVEMRNFIIDTETLSTHLHEVSSLYRFLPSVSYTLQF